MAGQRKYRCHFRIPVHIAVIEHQQQPGFSGNILKNLYLFLKVTVFISIFIRGILQVDDRELAVVADHRLEVRLAGQKQHGVIILPVLPDICPGQSRLADPSDPVQDYRAFPLLEPALYFFQVTFASHKRLFRRAVTCLDPMPVPGRILFFFTDKTLPFPQRFLIAAETGRRILIFPAQKKQPFSPFPEFII